LLNEALRDAAHAPWRGTIDRCGKPLVQGGYFINQYLQPAVPMNPTEPSEAAVLRPQHQPNELLTVLRVCEEYGLGRTMVYDALGTGALPAKIIGKRGTRIRRGDVDDWIRSLPAYRRLKER
jgi:predicted DNA-binding transcriptional regulator AlpA